MLRAELTGYADYVSDVTVSPRHVPTAGALWTGFSFSRYISHVKMRLRVMAEQVRRAIAWTYSNAASFDAIRSGSTLAVIPPGGTSATSRR